MDYEIQITCTLLHYGTLSMYRLQKIINQYVFFFFGTTTNVAQSLPVSLMGLAFSDLCDNP